MTIILEMKFRVRVCDGDIKSARSRRMQGKTLHCSIIVNRYYQDILNMKTYKPSDITPSDGLRNMSIAAIATGIIVGGFVGFISQFFYLLILFPIVMGGAAGTAISVAIKGGKVRNPIVAAGFAALTGLIMYGSMNYLQYIKFKQVVGEEIVANLGTAENTDKLTNDLLKEETGNDGFVGFVKYSAKQGTKISRAGSSGSGITLDENATWVYWLLELGIITGLAISMGYAAAAEPFCEEGNEWYGDKAWNGCVELSRKDEFLGLLKSDNFSQAGKLVHLTEDVELPRIDILLQSCATSKLSDFFLTVNKTSLNAKQNIESKKLASGLISHRQRLDLLAGQPISENVQVEDTQEDGFQS